MGVFNLGIYTLGLCCLGDIRFQELRDRGVPGQRSRIFSRLRRLLASGFRHYGLNSRSLGVWSN